VVNKRPLIILFYGQDVSQQLKENYKKKIMWYGCLTKQLGGEIVYHCTIFG